MLLMFAFTAYTIGTTTAGGSAIIFLLMLSWILPITFIPIVIAFVGTFAGLYRTFSFRKNIYWPILKWLLPGTILGSAIGASIFTALITKNGEHVLELVLALLLMVCGCIGLASRRPAYNQNNIWLFLPGGFILALISGIIGGAPPIINSLYQRFNISPQQIVGTKSINLLVLQLTKIIVYSFFISTHASKLLYGHSLYTLILFSLVASIGACFGITLGWHLLDKLNNNHFKYLINIMLILFGCYFFYLWL